MIFLFVGFVEVLLIQIPEHYMLHFNSIHIFNW